MHFVAFRCVARCKHHGGKVWWSKAADIIATRKQEGKSQKGRGWESDIDPKVRLHDLLHLVRAHLLFLSPAIKAIKS